MPMIGLSAFILSAIEFLNAIEDWQGRQEEAKSSIGGRVCSWSVYLIKGPG